jgi:serine/threonine-protein kinase
VAPFIDALLGVAIVPALLTTIGAGLLAAVRYELRLHVPEDRWLQFWESRAGRWLFKLAGLGTKRVAASGAYRPTELAIGLAADRLFEDLPEDVRASFGELPAVVRALEAHAEQVRLRMKELDDSVREIEADPRGLGGGDARAALARDLREAREAAERRRAEVVTALEAIRLQLLRLHAGVGSVEGMTADLGSAKELTADLQRLVDASRAVDDVLGVKRPRRSGDTPPAGAAAATAS